MTPLESTVPRLRKDLLRWFAEDHRKMPWRGSSDPYRIWVSEIMLQQTQVATVTPYYERFVGRFPTVQDLAQAALEDVLTLWAGLGYYSRARNLHAAAQAIVSEHAGRFPDSLEAVLALPGIGPYTAGAILSIAFNQPVPAVDGNVERVLSRICLIPGDPKRAPAKGQIRSVAQALVGCETPGAVTEALMELGAMVCSPTGPDCDRCPAEELCAAHQAGREQEFPQGAKRAATVKRKAAAAIIRRGEEVLVAKRPSGSVLAHLWEFPQADADRGQPAEALVRHVRERLGLEIEVGALQLRLQHGIMNQTITLQVFECAPLRGEMALEWYEEARWVAVEDLASLPFSSPHKKIVRYVRGAAGTLGL